MSNVIKQNNWLYISYIIYVINMLIYIKFETIVYNYNNKYVRAYQQ